MLYIKNGTIIDPASGTESQRNILIKDDRILKIGSDDEIKKEFNLIDIATIGAENLIVAPGFVDIHVHFRDPGFTYKEDVESGARAAAAGGYTRVVCMANTSPSVDCEEVLTDLRNRAKTLPVRVENTVNVTQKMQGKRLTDFALLCEKGACGVTDDGVPIMDEDVLKEALIKAKELNIPISLHEENPEFIEKSGYNKTAPSKAEEAMIERDAALNRDIGAKLDIQHLSSGGSVKLIRDLKKQGVTVFCEVTPQHISLTEEAVKTKGTLAKINPPLRTEEDRQELIKGLKDGTIDFIATDHAPHSKEDKEKGMYEAPSGMIGLETALSLCITNLVKPGHMSLSEVLKKMTVNPSEFYGFDSGYIKEGGPADLCIFDPKEEYTVTEDCFFGKSKNSPFIGERLTGRVKYTICRGQTVYKASP